MWCFNTSVLKKVNKTTRIDIDKRDDLKTRNFLTIIAAQYILNDVKDVTSIDVSSVIKNELTSSNEVCEANDFFKVNFIEANEAIIDETNEILDDFDIFFAI